MSAPAPTQPMAVLGIGALEQHGPHLPIGTDWVIASELSQRVAEALNARLLPTLPFSLSECHGSLPGTVWLKPATLCAILRDIVGALRSQGILKLLIINGHGGNCVLEAATQALSQEFPEMTLILPPEGWPALEGGAPIFEAPATDIHAGEIETSLLLHLYPALVKSERVDYVPPVGREFLDYVPLDRLCPEGVWGSASKGEAAKGERALAAQVQALAAFARQALEKPR
jgi:creatinine amidohydrolase